MPIAVQQNLKNWPHNMEWTNTQVYEPHKAGIYPAGGWQAYSDYEHGFCPEAGGLLDQPAIWVQTVRVCCGLKGDADSYISQRQQKAAKAAGNRRR